MLRQEFSDLDVLRSLPDYAEGYMATDNNTIYIGTTNNKRANTRHLSDAQVVDTIKGRDDYLGRVLYPEGRGDKWTYESNQAFVLGGIEARKTFVLVTPIQHYDKEYITTTVDELLWLNDNGYQFVKGNNDTLICAPGENKDPVIRNYNSGKGVIPPQQMNETKNRILGFMPNRVFTPNYKNSGRNTSSKRADNPWEAKPSSVRTERSWREKQPTVRVDMPSYRIYNDRASSNPRTERSWRERPTMPKQPVEIAAEAPISANTFS